MGKAKRTRAHSARDRIETQRAAGRRAAARRRALVTGGSVVAVLAVVIALIMVKLTGSPARASAATADAAVAREITSIPAATFNAVGAGTATGLRPISGQRELTLDGKPELLFIGGQYCPYCAAERWAVAAALSRFGTLTGLQFIHSSPTDSYPGTPTLSFDHASYASKYLAFAGVEWYSEKPDAATPTGYAYLVPEAQYLPSALAGLSWAQVAAAMRDPSSAVAQDIDGAANMITAAISRLTHGQPAAVGTSAAVAAASRAI